MKKKMISVNQVETILDVFGKLERFPYDKLNRLFDRTTIDEMHAIRREFDDWYQLNVLDKEFDKIID